MVETASINIMVQVMGSSLVPALITFAEANFGALSNRLREAALQIMGVLSEAPQDARVLALYKTRLPTLLPLVRVETEENIRESVLWVVRQLVRNMPQAFTTVLDTENQLATDIFDAVMTGLTDQSNLVAQTALWVVEAICSMVPFTASEAIMSRYEIWLSTACRFVSSSHIVRSMPFFNKVCFFADVDLFNEAYLIRYIP
jgi:hypothetical protein